MMSHPGVFEHAFQVSREDIDRLGHVNNVVYLRYAQDVAVAHWYAVVDQEHRDSMVWVVRRHEIDYLKPALENDELVARTWVGAPSGATLERFIEIRRSRDGEVLASVRSVWVALDAKTLRPRRVTEQLRSFFESCERGRKDPDGPG
jgi:acyl-CoA thioester hydrolase